MGQSMCTPTLCLCNINFQILILLDAARIVIRECTAVKAEINVHISEWPDHAAGQKESEKVVEAIGRTSGDVRGGAGHDAH